MIVFTSLLSNFDDNNHHHHLQDVVNVHTCLFVFIELLICFICSGALWDTTTTPTRVLSLYTHIFICIHRIINLLYLQWGLMGREPLEILRLAAGLWYTERRDLITSLHLLLRVFSCYPSHQGSSGHQFGYLVC